MKNIFYITTILITIILISSTPNVSAAEIEGIRFENSYETEGIRLKIQGTGLLRYLGFIKAYVGARYLEVGGSLVDGLSDKPNRLEVESFDALSGEDFGVTTDRVIAKNRGALSGEECRRQVA